MSRLWHFWIAVLLFHHLQIPSSSSSSSLNADLFESWLKEHGKTYSSKQEKQYRIKVLKDNYDYITQHNSKGNSTYTLSLNTFADLTHQEFKAKYLLGRPLSASANDLESSSALEDVDVAQPIHVGICASDRPFQFYTQGIFAGLCCDTLDHSVLIEGYDSRDGVEYWKIKNSWGTNWGINGYMHLARWNGYSCGINRQLMMNYLVKTTSPNPPLLPSPSGSRCFLIKCGGGATCCCYKRTIGFCNSFICCEAAYPVCCKVNHSCCPQEYPNCAPGKSGCFKKLGNITLTVPSKMEVLHTMLIN